MVGIEARWVPRPARQLKLQSAKTAWITPEGFAYLLSSHIEIESKQTFACACSADL